MIIDANAYLGRWAFRKLPVTDAEGLLRLMDRAGIDRAVVSSTTAVLYRNCADGNAELMEQIPAGGDRLLPLATINPSYAGWLEDLEKAMDDPRVVGVRAYPGYHGYPVESGPMMELASRLARAGAPLFLAEQFEDWRQRHRLDDVPNLLGAQVRFLVREVGGLRVVVTNACAPLVQEIHHGLDDEQASRVLFDNTFIWGPPVNELQRLVDAIGADRFVFGSHSPFKIPESGLKRIESLEVYPAAREGILGANIRDFLRLT